MWFKGILFLSYTALLLSPTSAALHSQDELPSHLQGRDLALEQHDNYPRGRRAVPWGNHTRPTSEMKTVETVSTTTLPVIITTKATQEHKTLVSSTSSTTSASKKDPIHHGKPEKSSTVEVSTGATRTSEATTLPTSDVGRPVTPPSPPHTPSSTTSSANQEDIPSHSNGTVPLRPSGEAPSTVEPPGHIEQPRPTSYNTEHTSAPDSSGTPISSAGKPQIEQGDSRNSTAHTSGPSYRPSGGASQNHGVPTTTDERFTTFGPVSSQERPSQTSGIEDSPIESRPIPPLNTPHIPVPGRNSTASTLMTTGDHAVPSSAVGNIPASETLSTPTDTISSPDGPISTSGVTFPGASATGDGPASTAPTSTLPSTVDTQAPIPLPTGSLKTLEPSEKTDLSTGPSILTTAVPMPGNFTGVPTSAVATPGISSAGNATIGSSGIRISASETPSGANTVKSGEPSSFTIPPWSGISGAPTGYSSLQPSLPSGGYASSPPISVIASSHFQGNSTGTPTSPNAISNTTPTATTPSTKASTQSGISSFSDISTTASGKSTQTVDRSSYEPATTTQNGYGGGGTGVVPSASTTTTAAAGGGAGEPPPLTKSQTAGIAIGGTTCLLIALVAALFVARRYHQNAGKRHSTGSVYPEVAYLYDPAIPRDGNDDAEAGGRMSTYMSGGATGYDAVPRNSLAESPHQRPYSAPQNGFGDDFIPPPHPSPAMSAYGSAQPSPRLTGYGGPLGGENCEYVQLGNYPYAFNPAAVDYPPMSPYANSSTSLSLLPSGPSTTTLNEPYEDHFERGVLLNVDARTETPDSIVVLAPPPSPRMPRSPARYVPNNLYNTHPPLGVLNGLSPNTIGNSPYSNAGISTPEAASIASSRSTAVSSSQRMPTPPPRIASPPRIHKGWDDIRLDDDEGVSPASSSDAILMPAPLAPIPRKPLPTGQHQESPGLAGARQLLLAGHGLPLVVKRKEAARGPGVPGKHAKGLGLEIPGLDNAFFAPQKDPTAMKREGDV